ncbi:MAG: GTPase ObgE [Erysipelotrichaceae bacterium]
MFIDRVKIKLKAGDGGNGIVAFRREKYVPLGGPAGGDGGKGGSIIFEVDTNKSTLLDLRYNRLLKAEDGGLGKIKKMHGKDGDDVIVKVPAGSVVKNIENDAIIADLTKVGQRVVIAAGGKGGRGNWHFATGRNSAPEYCEQGEPGDQLEISVELKLLADVGLVGFPSVGKSTLLSVVSKAKPEIADYHFTTITPNLGMVKVSDGRSFVMADLPGLIEGASQGKGLGHQFLRHIERCRVILHVVDMGANDGRDPIDDYQIIRDELAQYQMRLTERPEVVIANKMDLERAQDNLARFKENFPNVTIYETVTIINEGLDPVLYKVADLLATTPEFPLYDEETEQLGVLYKYEDPKDSFTVVNEGNGKWRIEGIRIEKLFLQTDLKNDESTLRFATQLRKLGVDEVLRNKGCQNGDIVYIKNYGFEFVDEE